MRTLARALGYLVLFLMLAALVPFILLLAAWDWVQVWRGKSVPSPFIPERRPEVYATNYFTIMSRGRELQRKEEE